MNLNYFKIQNWGVQEIMEVLPHRYPFLLIDRIVSVYTKNTIHSGIEKKELARLREGTRVHAQKCVSVNEWPFVGHFPSRPVFPGVLTLEAMAQTAAFAAVPFIAAETQGKMPPLELFLAGFDSVRFRRLIQPGDLLDIFIEVTQTKGAIWSCSGQVLVTGQKAAEASMLAQVKIHDSSNGSC